MANSFIGRIGDINRERSHLEDDLNFGQFEYSEKHHEFKTKALIREKYEFQNIAPYKRPSKPYVNRNEMWNTNVEDQQSLPFMAPTKSKIQNFSGKHHRTAIPFDSDPPLNRKQTWKDDSGIDDPLDDPSGNITSTLAKVSENSQKVRNYDFVNSRRVESGKKYVAPTVAMNEITSYDTNLKQYKYEMKNNATSTKRVRNTSPCNSSFFEPPPAKMISSLAKAGENVQEKDTYTSTPPTGQPIMRETKSSTIRNQQSTKDDHPLSKSEQPEKPTPSSNENSQLKEALEKSKLALNQLESESRKCENLLLQATQTKENLQKQITELDREKQMCITDFHQYYCRANTILKLQTQFDEKIELLAGFLSNEKKLKETISFCLSSSHWTKLQETLKFCQKSRGEMEIVKRTCYESTEKLRSSVEEALVGDAVESNLQQLVLDVVKHFTFCREKRTRMQTMYDQRKAEISKMEAEIDELVTNTDCERDQMEAKLIGLSQRVKFEAGLLRKESSVMKDEAIREIAKQKEIISSLKNEHSEIMAEVEQLLAENRDVQRDIDSQILRKEEVDRDLSSVEHEINELMAKLDVSREQIKSETNRNMSLIRTKSDELEEMKREMLSLETKRNDLIQKVGHFRSANESKNKLSQLRDKIETNARKKQTLEENITALKSKQQAEESEISALEEKIKASKEKKLQLLQQTMAFNNLQLQEKKAQTSILETISSVKGYENSTRDAKERELSSLYDDIVETLFSIDGLEQQQDLISKENIYLDNVNRMKKKDLVKIRYEKEKIESEIQMIKKLVRDKVYTTAQEVNKALNSAIKKKNAEESAVSAFEEDLNQQKLRLDQLRKKKNSTQRKE